MTELPIIDFGTSLVDWPGHIAVTIFTQGCPWNCVYCHNPELRAFRQGKIKWDTVLREIGKIRAVIDGVVFSGGEPTIHNLSKAIEDIKALDLKVGLHTTGVFKHNFQTFLPFLDWVGFDIKAPFDLYPSIAECPTLNVNDVKVSLKTLVESGKDCEFRTTVCDEINGPEIIQQLLIDIEALGVRTLVLQKEERNFHIKLEKLARSLDQSQVKVVLR